MQNQLTTSKNIFGISHPSNQTSIHKKFECLIEQKINNLKSKNFKLSAPNVTSCLTPALHNETVINKILPSSQSFDNVQSLKKYICTNTNNKNHSNLFDKSRKKITYFLLLCYWKKNHALTNRSSNSLKIRVK